MSHHHTSYVKKGAKKLLQCVNAMYIIDILFVYYAGLCHIIIHPMSKRVPRNSFNAAIQCILLIYCWYIIDIYAHIHTLSP